MATYDDLFTSDSVAPSSPSASVKTGYTYDDLFPSKPTTLIDRAKDIGITGLKSAIGVPEAALGLADIATGGRAGKYAEEAGFRPREAKDILETYYSPAQQAANANVRQAEGFVPTLKAYAQNPSVLAHDVGEQAFPILAGGVMGAGVGALAPNLAKAAPYLPGAVGEAGLTAGQNAEQVRQQTENGLLDTEHQTLPIVASSLVTGGIGALGGKLANKLGFTDVQRLASGMGSSATNTGLKGVVRNTFGTTAIESLEEGFQSPQEQVAQNYALDRPLTEGVGSATAQGLLLGGAMGGGTALVDPANYRKAPVQPEFEQAPLINQPQPSAFKQRPAGPLTRAAAQAQPIVSDVINEAPEADASTVINEATKRTQEAANAGPTQNDINQRGPDAGGLQGTAGPVAAGGSNGAADYPAATGAEPSTGGINAIIPTEIQQNPETAPGADGIPRGDQAASDGRGPLRAEYSSTPEGPGGADAASVNNANRQALKQRIADALSQTDADNNPVIQGRARAVMEQDAKLLDSDKLDADTTGKLEKRIEKIKDRANKYGVVLIDESKGENEDASKSNGQPLPDLAGDSRGGQENTVPGNADTTRTDSSTDAKSTDTSIFRTGALPVYGEEEKTGSATAALPAERPPLANNLTTERKPNVYEQERLTDTGTGDGTPPGYDNSGDGETKTGVPGSDRRSMEQDLSDGSAVAESERERILRAAGITNERINQEEITSAANADGKNTIPGKQKETLLTPESKDAFTPTHKLNDGYNTLVTQEDDGSFTTLDGKDNYTADNEAIPLTPDDIKAYHEQKAQAQDQEAKAENQVSPGDLAGGSSRVDDAGVSGVSDRLPESDQAAQGQDVLNPVRGVDALDVQNNALVKDQNKPISIPENSNPNASQTNAGQNKLPAQELAVSGAKAGNEAQGFNADAEVKQPWDITSDEYILKQNKDYPSDTVDSDITRFHHKKMVESALRRGEITTNALSVAEYPDLISKYGEKVDSYEKQVIDKTIPKSDKDLVTESEIEDRLQSIHKQIQSLDDINNPKNFDKHQEKYKKLVSRRDELSTRRNKLKRDSKNNATPTPTTPDPATQQQAPYSDKIESGITPPVTPAQAEPVAAVVPTVAKTGKPFSTEKVAQAALKSSAYPETADTHKVVPVNGGFGLAPITNNQEISSKLVNQEKALTIDSDEGKSSKDFEGDKINKSWTKFADDSGSLNIPRSEMPQVKAEHRGALVNFLNAKGIKHKKQTISAEKLKPTQAEFSPEKVKKAQDYEGGNRSILISSDNHVVDGHHQWLAKLNNKESIDVIRLNKPIKSLLDDVKEFPSAEQSGGAKPLSLNQEPHVQEARTPEKAPQGEAPAAEASVTPQDALKQKVAAQREKSTLKPFTAQVDSETKNLKLKTPDAISRVNNEVKQRYEAQIKQDVSEGKAFTKTQLNDIADNELEHLLDRDSLTELGYSKDMQDQLYADNNKQPAPVAEDAAKKAGDDGVLFSRSESTKDAYEKRIDELFNRAPPKQEGGVTVLDNSDILGMLGYPKQKISLVEKKVILSSKEENHNMTAELWKKIPEWLENPVAVFDSETEKGRLVFVAPETVNNNPIFMIVDPNAIEGRARVYLLVNGYDRSADKIPSARWVKDEKLRYIDNEKSRAISAASRLQLPAREQQNKPGSKVKILTEKNLVKYRNQNKFSQATPTTGSTRETLINNLSAGDKKLLQSGRLNVVQSVSDLPAYLQNAGKVQKDAIESSFGKFESSTINNLTDVGNTFIDFISNLDAGKSLMKKIDNIINGSSLSESTPGKESSEIQSRNDGSIRESGLFGYLSISESSLEQRNKLVNIVLDLFRNVNSSYFKSVAQRRLGYAKFFSDLSHSNSFIEHGFSDLNVPSQRIVKEMMVLLGHDDKVLDSIIGLYSVDMVNMLRSGKLTPQMLLHNVSMLKDIPTFKSNDSVTSAVNRPRSSIGTSAGGATERPGFGSLKLLDVLKNLNSANNASALNFAGQLNGARIVARHDVTPDSNVVLGGKGADTSLSPSIISKLSNVQGIFDGKSIYLVADNLNPATLPGVLLHEKLHAAIASNPKLKERLLGSQSELQDIFNKTKSGSYSGRYKSIYDAAMRRVEKAGTKKSDALEEWISYNIELYNKPTANLPERLLKAIKDLVAVIKAAIFRHSGQIANISPADLSALAKSSLSYSEKPNTSNAAKPNAALASVKETKEQQEYDATRAKYFGTKDWMKAPNGKPTKLNEVQWVQTRTPAFREWFGDWLNDPENASKLVNENGEPEVFYHLTENDVTSFVPGGDEEDFARHAPIKGSSGARKAGVLGMSSGPAIWLADRPDHVQTSHGKPLLDSDYGRKNPNIIPVFLNVRKNITMDSEAAIKEIYNKYPPNPLSHPVPYMDKDYTTQEMKKIFPDKTDFPMIIDWTQRNLFLNAGIDGLSYGYSPSKGSDRINEYIVFNPNQIKSATGNTGAFSSQSNDIRYSVAEDVRQVQERLTTGLIDRLSTNKTFNWWHKTVGTQFHKALIDKKHFGKVFSRSMQFEQDLAKMANEAADLAPSLLPKLDALADIGRELTDFAKGAIKLQTSQRIKDARKVGEAVFETTLMDKPMTTRELQDAGYTPAQQTMYREFFASVNKSLDDLAKSELFRMARALKLDQAPDSLNLKDTADWYANQTNANEGKDFIDKAAQIAKLKDEGYAPLMRFGQYTVDVVGTAPDGSEKREFFGLFETEQEAKEMERIMQGEYPDADITRGVMSQNDWQMFKGITPETMEIFAKMMNVEQDDAFQTYLKSAVTNRSAMKRLIHRKKMPGFAKDTQRVLASFITSNARMASKNYHLGELVDAIASIPKEKGDVIDEAVNLYNYVQNPSAKGAAIRGLLFAWYLGGSVSSAAVNLTQSLTTTLPYLHQFGSTKQVAKILANALKQAANHSAITGDLGKALRQADKEGITEPHEIHSLYGESMRTGLLQNQALRPIAKVWGSLFSLAESYNRRVAFIAAHTLATENGIADPFRFAEEAVNQTQFVYSKSARPNWARSTVGQMVFTFKTFSISYLEFLKRLPAKEQALALGVLVMFAGLGGAPGADDLDDLIDTLGQAMGYNTNSKAWKEKVLDDMIGKEAAQYALYGISHGLPIDVSSRLGVGNIIPGSALLKKSETDKTRDVMEFVGPVGSLSKKIVDAFEAAGSRDSLTSQASAVGKSLVPKAISDVAQAIDMMQTGQYRDTRGRKVSDADMTDALSKLLGFQPTNVAEPRRAERYLNQSVTMAKAVESDIASLWASGVVEKNRDKVDEAKAMLKDWNEKNADTPIKVNMKQILSRVRQMRLTSGDRLLKSTPKELRKYAREAMRD